MKRIVTECDICGGEGELTRVRIQVGDMAWAGGVDDSCSTTIVASLSTAAISLKPAPKRGRPAKTVLAVVAGDVGAGVPVCAICGESETCDKTICHEHAGGGLKTECTACAGLKDEQLG
jgi:hypothetical protein